MQGYKVIVTWEAVYDVAEVAEYIESSFGMERADRFQDDMRKQMENLETMGTMFGQTNLYYRGYCIYKKPFPPSVIFYIIKEQEKEVHVLRVLRQERDWKKMLADQQDYTYP